MKRLILAIVVAFTLSSCATGYYSATYVNDVVSYPAHTTGMVNISIQPSWGPAGYNYAMYYYFPEFNFYYDVDRALFYYLSSGRWVSAKVLPKGRLFPTDLHRYYKVVINERNPWNYNRQHKSKYKHYKGIYTQRNLRDERMGKDAPRRIQSPQHSTPSRNNNTMYSPHNTPHRGQGGNAGYNPSVGKPQGSGSRPSGTTPPRNNSSQGGIKRGGGSPLNGSVKPSGGSTPPRGTAKPSGNGGSKGSTSKSSVSKSSSSKSSSSSSGRSSSSHASGSRSTGSRGR
jgi:hypothetical protein